MIKRAPAYSLTALGPASTYATLALAQPQQPSTQKKTGARAAAQLADRRTEPQPGLATDGVLDILRIVPRV
jgi:hypothetical protein